jgi:hypothetical protein
MIEMSKVVHLSDDAHKQAKVFCREKGLKMSDWVATLIGEAIAKGHTDAKVRTLVPKKRILERLETKSQLQPPAQAAAAEEDVPAYARPPFWANK